MVLLMLIIYSFGILFTDAVLYHLRPGSRGRRAVLQGLRVGLRRHGRD